MLVRALLAIDPDGPAARAGDLVDRRDVSISSATIPEEVWQVLQHEQVDLVLADEALTGPSCEHWVDSIRGLPDPPELVILTDWEDSHRRARLLAAGCLAVLDIRIPDPELRRALRAIVDRVATAPPPIPEPGSTARRADLEDVVGRSAAMAEVLSIARRVATSDSSILVLGETGVGKERLARAVHLESARASGPFVAVNCGAIPDGLLESELFGHERGAFTGAVRSHRGQFELAHRGTLFLDEIGELPLALQVKLLRVLEDRSVQRLGSERAERVNVRIIAATGRDLEAEVAGGRFRADLYFRLAVVTLHIPPLRQRREDIAPLVERYLAVLGRSLGRGVSHVEDDAMEALLRYDWPGNVRELINVLERALLLAAGPSLRLGDLPRTLVGRKGGEEVLPTPLPAFHHLPAEVFDQPIGEARRAAVEAFEREYLTRLLTANEGRIGATARRAGVTPRALYDLMQRTGLRKEDFKGE